VRALWAFTGDFIRFFSVTFLVSFTFVIGAIPVRAIAYEWAADRLVVTGLDSNCSKTVFCYMICGVRQNIIVDGLAKEILSRHIRHLDSISLDICSNNAASPTVDFGKFYQLSQTNYKMRKYSVAVATQLFRSEEHVWIGWISEARRHAEFLSLCRGQRMDKRSASDRPYIFWADFYNDKIPSLGLAHIHYLRNIFPDNKALILSDGPYEVRNNNVSTPLGLHLTQLTLHYVKLPTEDNSSYDADNHESASEQSDMARPARHHSFVYLVLGIAVTAAAVFVAFKSAEYADDHESRFWWVPFLGFLALAFWLVDHVVLTAPLM
jgi:hypothetical protein